MVYTMSIDHGAEASLRKTSRLHRDVALLSELPNDVRRAILPIDIAVRIDVPDLVEPGASAECEANESLKLGP